MRSTMLLLVVLAVASSSVGGSEARLVTQDYTRGQLRGIVSRQFSKAGSWAVRRAFCIVGRESSWNPRAISRTGDYGLFQINYSAHHSSYDFGRMLEPRYNTAVAWRLSGGGRDWSPWAGGAYPC